MLPSYQLQGKRSMGPISMARIGYGKMIFVMIVTCLVFMDGAAGGRGTHVKRSLKMSAVKTIKSEDGNIIDCVDIYKQPAFYHPLLRNHTIQMRPSNFVSKKMFSSKPKLPGQLWHKSGRCPRGTIPILRNDRNDLLTAVPQEYSSVDFAKVQADVTNYGAEAIINIWNVFVNDGELSSASVQVGKKDLPDLINVGWVVSPGNIYCDNKTRVYTRWATDTAGCYNLECPGFVQVSQDAALGSSIESVSTYNGDQYLSAFTILKDNGDEEGNWWFFWHGTPVGYWPTDLFENMGNTADYVKWGGHVYNSAPGGQHTNSQMGSGHPPQEGSGKAAFIGGCTYLDDFTQRQTLSLSQLNYLATSRACYDITTATIDSPTPGFTFYYGGTGTPGCDQ